MSEKRLRIVFDGPPGPEAGRFVEVETEEGKGVRFGEWEEGPDGLWYLWIPDNASLRTQVAELTASEEKRRQEVIELTIQMHELEAERDRLREAVEEIVQFHDGYCEQHINVSQHSHDLAAIAQAAKEAQDAQV